MTPLRPPSDYTVADLLQRYLREIPPTQADTTRIQKTYLFRWLDEELGGMPLSRLTPTFLAEWRESLLRRWSAGTVKRYMEVLSGPLTFAVTHLQWLEDNPMRRVTKPSQPRERMRVLTKTEQACLLACCERTRNRHLYVIVVLALATGMRREEIRRLRWQQIDLQEGTITLVDTKNKLARVVPCAGHAVKLLHQRYDAWQPQPQEWVFPTVNRDQPWEFQKAWDAARKAAGLADVRFHDLRHTAATNLAASGADQFLIRAILGHRSLQMTARYIHMPIQPMKEAVEKMLGMTGLA